jgi:hypothetical protein
MVDILYQLRPYIDQIIVISPTDRQNHTYDRGIAPLPCIHYGLTAKLLDDIWDRQTALASVYTKANNPDCLKKLFERIPNMYAAKAAIESINNKLRSYQRELNEIYNDGGADSEARIKDKMAEMETECKKMILLVYKHYINGSRDYLSKQRLSQDEAYTLRYLNLNPRLVLIFDDCTDLLNKFKGHRVMQKLFYQGRWAFITALIACHTDKALNPELKKNAFVSVFTEEGCAHGYFHRKSNDLDKDAVTKATAACKIAFTPLAKYQKLVWVRDEKKFYTLTATKHENFKFGSAAVWEYCSQCQAEAGSISSDNKFISEFQ